MYNFLFSTQFLIRNLECLMPNKGHVLLFLAKAIKNRLNNPCYKFIDNWCLVNVETNYKISELGYQ